MPNSTSVSDFLAALPADRVADVKRLRAVIRAHLPRGYEEAVVKGTLVYQVPLAAYPDTYNGHPLWYAALASQKSYLSLYLMSVYGDPALAERLRAGFRDAGKKLAMGKSCINFQRVDDLALDVIGEIIGALPMERWIAIAQSARRSNAKTVRPTAKAVGRPKAKTSARSTSAARRRA